MNFSRSIVKVNDIHSRLNETEVAEILLVDSLETLHDTVTTIAARGGMMAIAGGWHSMGGQQFASGACLLDTRGMSGVLNLDRERGLIEVEAGIQWPELVRYLIDEQAGEKRQWGIAQKQTGADRFTIGGSVSVNCHGRGLDCHARGPHRVWTRVCEVSVCSGMMIPS